jgi:hypothetical protein
VDTFDALLPVARQNDIAAQLASGIPGAGVVTPRSRGIVDELYAVQAAAQRIGDPALIERAHQLQLSITEQSLPLVTGWYYKGKVEDLAADEAKVLGYNPIDVPDNVGVGSADQNAVVGGDVNANLAAIAADVKDTAREEAQAAADAAKKAATFTWDALKDVVIAAVVFLVIYALATRRSA